jgi:hypothetical protein
MFAAAPGAFGISARASVVSLLSQSLQSASAVKTAMSIPSTAATDTDVPALDCVAAYLALAQMHALLGRLVEASQWTRKARSSLDADKSNSLLQAMRKHSSASAAKHAVSKMCVEYVLSCLRFGACDAM